MTIRKMHDVREAAKTYGMGKVIEIHPGKGSFLNPMQPEKSELTKEFLDKKELELRHDLDEFDKIPNMNIKEICKSYLEDGFFLNDESQPKEWRDRLRIVLTDYANR